LANLLQATLTGTVLIGDATPAGRARCTTAAAVDVGFVLIGRTAAAVIRQIRIWVFRGTGIDEDAHLLQAFAAN
jgi:hypothetical protein